MRSSTFAVAATVLVSLLAVSESGVTDPKSLSFIDSVIKGILESMRPKFADLKVDDIEKEVENPSLNATIIAKNIHVTNLDKFVIENLKSNILFLRLTNLTLTWNEVVASAFYDFDVLFNVPKYQGPFHIFGKGDAKASLSKVFLTIGADMQLKNKVLQVKPKGLFGFDLNIESANVTLTSMQGSTEFGDALGVFLSNIIPDLVNTLKQPIFNAFKEDIIAVVNEILKGHDTFIGSSLADDEGSMDYLDHLFNFSDEVSEL